MDAVGLCTEAVVHQNSLKQCLLTQLSSSISLNQQLSSSTSLIQQLSSTAADYTCLFPDTTISLADGQLTINRIYLGLMFPGLGRLADFDGRAEVFLCLPDFKRADLLQLAKRILVPSRPPEEAGDRALMPHSVGESKSRITNNGGNLESAPKVRENGFQAPRIGEGMARTPETGDNVMILPETGDPGEDNEGSSVAEQEWESASPKYNTEPEVTSNIEEKPTLQPVIGVELVQHRCDRQSKQRRPHACSECPEIFPSRRALVEHCRQCHQGDKQQGVQEKKRFPCSYCPEVYNRQDYLKVFLVLFLVPLYFLLKNLSQVWVGSFLPHFIFVFMVLCIQAL